MKDELIHNLILFINRNKSLTKKQQSKRDWLISRDYSKLSKIPYKRVIVEKKNQTTVVQSFHMPREVSRLLQRFSGDNGLKFTTHKWDKKEVISYDDFCNKYKTTLTSDSLWDKLFSCNNRLYYLIYNYLLNDKSGNIDSKFWSINNRITIGVQNPREIIRNWLSEHPESQIFDIPLSEFREGFTLNKTNRINGVIPTHFAQIADLFKHCIEFRGEDYYDMLERIFLNSDLHLDEESLKSLEGISFFTATELVQQALLQIEDNIRSRKKNSTEVKIWNVSNTEYNELHILHVNSYSMTELDNKKLMLQAGESQMKMIKNYLQSLCDFSVISRFIDRGKEVDARIAYLYSENAEDIPQKTVLENGTSKGFEYILKFYK